MSRWHSYLNSGKTIIENFDGRSPLATWLKDFFREHKQMGSRDRKIISELVYSFYRVGHAVTGMSPEDQLLCGIFACSNKYIELLHNFRPGWNSNIGMAPDEKALYLGAEGLQWNPENIFPWQSELGDDIDKHLFTRSHLHQPNLYLRLRPHKKKIVTGKLHEASIEFTMLGDDCIVLPNGTKIDQLFKIDEDAVVQDYNSQRVGEFFKLNSGSALSVWDCCAGSGGKSIMAHDINPAISLSVSDSRISIIQNLNLRFQSAGIVNYRPYVADLTLQPGTLPTGPFDYIIADVPCSGSGTWARTPEQLYFFDPKRIKYYSGLQKNIVSNIIPKLKHGGRLTYITCSVFKEENENVVDFIKMNFNVQLEQMELLKGYEKKADTLFAATFKLSEP